jgi:HlyD family secretion protein
MNRYSTSKLQVLLLIAVVLTSCKSDKDGIKPTVKPLIEAVYASGFVVSRDEYEIISQAEGYISEKLVDDGTIVKKGDPIYVLDSDQPSARTNIARETYALAAKNNSDDSPALHEIKAALESAQTKMSFDSVNFVRYSNLMKENATSRSEFDRVRLVYENSRNEYFLQKSRYEKIKNQLFLDMQNARNNLVIASDEAGRFIIRSEADGMVFQTIKEKGELIRRNELVAVVGKNDAYVLQLDVDELDVQRLKQGQEVLVKIDAYPSKTFKASVTKIYPMVNRRLQSVRVDAELQEKLPGWFSGLALEANIVVHKKDKALVIPKSAVLPGDSVNIRTDDGVKKVRIVKGIETLDEVEVVEGLDAGKLIVLNPS